VQRLAWMLVLLGLISGFVVGGQRLALESGFDTVEIAVDLEDLVGGDLAKTTDMDGLLAEITDWGVESLVITVSPQEPWTSPRLREIAQAIKAAGYQVILKIGGDEDYGLDTGQKFSRPAASSGPTLTIPELASLVSMIEPEVVVFGGGQVVGYPSELSQVALLLRASNTRFGWQEFANQSGETELVRLAPLHMVRVHTIYPRELPRYDLHTAETRFMRAVRERSYRLLYIRALPEWDLSRTKALVKDLNGALGKAGYSRGQASSLPPWRTGLVPFLLATCGWLGGGILLYRALRAALPGPLAGRQVASSLEASLDRLAIPILGCVAAIVVATFLYYNEILARQALAFLAAVTFPALAVMPQRWSSKAASALGPRKSVALSRSLKEFGQAAGIALAGAAVVIAALGDFRFMLKVVQFRGVKAMSLLPVVLVIGGAIVEGFSLDRTFTWRHKWGKVPAWMRVCLIFFALLVGIIYIGRTGNFIIPVPAWELRLREFLEQVFPYRPRTKELLIGYPLLILGFGLFSWGWYRVGLFTAALGTIGPVSMVNTFTHIHSPLIASISRTIVGLVIGACLGIGLLYSVLSVAPSPEEHDGIRGKNYSVGEAKVDTASCRRRRR